MGAEGVFFEGRKMKFDFQTHKNNLIFLFKDGRVGFNTIHDNNIILPDFTDWDDRQGNKCYFCKENKPKKDYLQNPIKFYKGKDGSFYINWMAIKNEYISEYDTSFSKIKLEQDLIMPPFIGDLSKYLSMNEPITYILGD